MYIYLVTCRWPNPMYVGTFAAGLFHTMICSVFHIYYSILKPLDIAVKCSRPFIPLFNVFIIVTIGVGDLAWWQRAGV